MASKMIGRADCPECGFKGAHVKESEKCLYRYCPECGAQHHARTDRQRADLLKKSRLIEPTPTPSPTPAAEKPAKPAKQEATPTPSPSEPTTSPSDTPTPAKRRGLFS